MFIGKQNRTLESDTHAFPVMLSAAVVVELYCCSGCYYGYLITKATVPISIFIQVVAVQVLLLLQNKCSGVCTRIFLKKNLECAQLCLFYQKTRLKIGRKIDFLTVSWVSTGWYDNCFILLSIHKHHQLYV